MGNLRMHTIPNIQYLFGKGGVEGPYLSAMYHSREAAKDEDITVKLTVHILTGKMKLLHVK